MSKPGAFNQSVAVFDDRGGLVDWNSGFTEEFADAATLLDHGVNARAISAACLLPERALDLSWSLDGEAPPAFEYINSRRSIRVTQHPGANGHVFRIAQCNRITPPLHPAMEDESTELLRSTVLQISAAVLKRREQENHRLLELALQDGLTLVANRRYFDELLNIEWQRCQKDELPLSVFFIDIDFFKRYNDIYGHPSGDECLKTIASTIKAHLNRPRDLVSRYGGEEFTCLLPATDLADATRKAIELEKAIRAMALPHIGSEVAPIVTISLGVATARHMEGGEASLLIRAADQLLYDAKAAGRGCARSALYTPFV
ncbi:diguanylate cyclase [Vreelandella sp. EE7]